MLSRTAPCLQEYNMKKEIINENGKKYLIDNPIDREIYKKIKYLENIKVSKVEGKLIKIIKTQLEPNWRKYLLIELNKLLRKY